MHIMNSNQWAGASVWADYWEGYPVSLVWEATVQTLQQNMHKKSPSAYLHAIGARFQPGA